MENEENVVRLAKPVKKGLLRLVFSRFGLIALLILIQIAIMVAAYGFFREQLPVLTVLQTIFTIGMIIYLFNCSMDSSAKLTWMLIIAVVPLVGTAFLLFTQSNFGHRMEKEMVENQINMTKNMLDQPENVSKELEHDGSGTDDLCRYLNRTGCFPLYDHTAVTYYSQGEDKFEAMLRGAGKGREVHLHGILHRGRGLHVGTHPGCPDAQRPRKASRSASCTTACAKCPRCRWTTGSC